MGLAKLIAVNCSKIIAQCHAHSAYSPSPHQVRGIDLFTFETNNLWCVKRMSSPVYPMNIRLITIILLSHLLIRDCNAAVMWL